MIGIGERMRETHARPETVRRFFIGLAAVSVMLRCQHGWSQREVARRAGVGARFVSDVENERADPPATRLDQLAKGLGLTGIGELMTLADEAARRLSASVIPESD